MTGVQTCALPIFAFFLEVIPLGVTLGIVYGDNLPDADKWQEFVLTVLAPLMGPGA